MPEGVLARLAEIFGVGTTAAANGSSPPESVVTLPLDAQEGSEHANALHAHLPDWFA